MKELYRLLGGSVVQLSLIMQYFIRSSVLAIVFEYFISILVLEFYNPKIVRG